MTEVKQNIYTIGQVVEKLQSFYSDISISKIRFFEQEGLIKPKRSSGGYRKFSEDDVKRLNAILKLQKDQYMPLSVIKKNISLIGKGIEPSKETLIESEQSLLDQPKTVTLDDAVRKVRLTSKQIDELTSYSIIKKKDESGQAAINELDLEILAMVKSLSKFGIEPRHLKMYVNFSDKESLMVEQIAAPYSKNKKRLEEKLTDISKILQSFKKALLKRSLIDIYTK